jgi:hypothetical protein
VAKAILGTVCGGLADDLPKSAAGLGNLCRTDVAEHVQHPDEVGALGPEYAPTVLTDEPDGSVLSRQPVRGAEHGPGPVSVLAVTLPGRGRDLL